MAYTRRSTFRRRPIVRRRRRFVRRAPRMRMSRPVRARISKVHHFSRWMTLVAANPVDYGLNIVPGSGSSVVVNPDTFALSALNGQNNYFSFGWGFQFRTMPDYTEFSLLFDKYRVNGISLRITPLYNDWYPSALPNGGLQMPIIHSVIDYNDALPAAATINGVGLLREYDTYKLARMDQKKFFSRYWKPHTLGSLASGEGTTETACKDTRAGWVSFDSIGANLLGTTVDHYGAKWIIEILNGAASAAFTNFKIEAKIYFSCVNTR